METAQNNYSGWTLVELFGHQKEAGFVTTEYFGTAAMFRIDVPGMDEREWELERPEYGAHTGYRELPIGTKVKRSAIAPRSRLMGVSAIYGMTPCTEEIVKKAIEQGIQRPLIVLSLPEGKQLAEKLPGEAEDALGKDICDNCGFEIDECQCECEEDEAVG